MNALHQNWIWLHDFRASIVRMVFLASLAIGAHADWQWSDQVDTLGPTGSESPFAFPQVRVDPISGIATAAWIDTTTFMNEKVQAVRFTNGQWGIPETISQKLNPVGPGNTGPTLIPARGLAAQVAPGKNGDVTVAWTSLLPNQYALSGTQWKKAKARWSGPVYTPMENIGLGDPPQIRIGKDQNGITTAVWRGNAPDGTHLIQSSRFTNGRWGKPKTLFQGGNLSEPQIAVAKNGAVMVLWTVYEDENHARIVSRLFSGGQWKPLYNFSDSVAAISKVNTSHSIISHRSGSFTAVWHQYDGEYSRIMIRRYINGKGYEYIQGVAQAKGKNLYYPAVASNESGTAIIVVYSAKNSTSAGDVMNTVEASTKEGTGDWTAPRIIGLSSLKLSVPQVAMDGEANSTIVWEEEIGTSTGNRWLVRATRHSPGPWIFKQFPVCSDCSSPSLAVDKAGNAWVVWVAVGQVQSKRGGNSLPAAGGTPPKNVNGCVIASKTKCPDWDLEDADLSGADLAGADLSSANLMGANLTGANLSGANLNGANFMRANLTSTNLTSSTLVNAWMGDSTLAFADVSFADLTNAYMGGSIGQPYNFYGAILCNTVDWNGERHNRDCRE